MKVSAEGQSVVSEILVEFDVVLLLSIPLYIAAQDWFRLTVTIISCIVFLRFAILLRKKTYDKSE
jgi:hypothetical protein